MCCVSRYKAWTLANLLASFLFVLTIEASAQNQPIQTQLHFDFASGAQTFVEGVQKLVPVEKKTVLKFSDLIKFFLQSNPEIYFYFFHLSSRGNLTILSPINNQSPKLNPGAPGRKSFF